MKKAIVVALERIANRRVFFGFGAVGATSVLSSFFGISLVAHSSGGALLTAGSGYIAGTFITASVVALFWILLPFAVLLGLVLTFKHTLILLFDRLVKKAYFWRNPQ